MESLLWVEIKIPWALPMKYYNIYNSFKSINNNKSSAILHKFSTFSRFYAKQFSAFSFQLRMEANKTRNCMNGKEFESWKWNGSHFRIMSCPRPRSYNSMGQLNRQKVKHPINLVGHFGICLNSKSVWYYFSVIFLPSTKNNFFIYYFVYHKGFWNYFCVMMEQIDSDFIGFCLV